jgi:sialate O-acetylesterase
MIAPILNYGIKGAIWYQGESNAGSAADAVAYEKLFPDMINDWRTRWGQGDFPFYWVQLANFRPATNDANAESHWAVLRESQTSTLALPNTHEAVIIDIGEAKDIHPRNKKDVGYRLALGARKGAYGESGILASSSQAITIRRDGPGLIVKFDHVGSKIEVRDKYGYIKGFAIAGVDGNFQWANAQLISNDEVLLISPLVPNPTQVKYGWADNPEDLNLNKQAWLPEPVFRKKL